MGAVVDNLNEAEKGAEEVGFQRKRSILQHSSTSTSSDDKDIQGGGLEFIQSELTQKLEVITAQVEAKRILQHDNIQNSTILPASYPPIPEGSTSLSNVKTEIRTVAIVKENEQGRQELYLERVYQKPPTHGFYCPNCKACIQTVYIQKGELEQTSAPVKPPQPKPSEPIIRCSTCFSFLIPIGSWLFPCWVDGESGELNEQGQIEQTVLDVSQPLLPSRESSVPTSSKAWEILKSVVYGGLTELVASLSIVTSAASADATTLNIVALAIASLVGGLFILAHNLTEMKAEKPKTSDQNQTNAPVDRYNELLGQRENFILHAFFAILSFIVFGLVPPLAYGLSFRESGDKDHKLAAVAVASLLCMTLLSIAKAHIQRPSSYETYFKTWFYYVNFGALASLHAYLAGKLLKKFLEKLGWFDSSASNSFAFQAHGMSVDKPTWSSY